MRVGALVLLILSLPALAFASRASQEGRVLPRLLSEDVSLVRFLPSVLSGQDRFFLVDVSNTSAYSLSNVRYGRLPTPTLGFQEGSDDLAAVILGGRTRFGYVLDGSTHNLVVAGGGWGLILGVSDGYQRNLEESADTSRAISSLNETELSRRLVRLGGGWTFAPGGRRVSVGLGVTYLDVDYTSDHAVVSSGVSSVFRGSWNSSPGLGFDVTVQSLSPRPGLQLGGQLALESMNEESSVPIGTPLRRRHAVLQAGWRVDTQAVDDLMVGVTASWVTQTDATISGSTAYQAIVATKTTDYFGGIFVSAEHEVLDGLRLRGGVLGAARVTTDKRYQTREDVDGFSDSVSEQSTGVVNSPEFALGGSWNWRAWLLELQINKSLYVTSPVVRWAATLEF